MCHWLYCISLSLMLLLAPLRLYGLHCLTWQLYLCMLPYFAGGRSQRGPPMQGQPIELPGQWHHQCLPVTHLPASGRKRDSMRVIAAAGARAKPLVGPASALPTPARRLIDK